MSARIVTARVAGPARPWAAGITGSARPARATRSARVMPAGAARLMSARAVAAVTPVTTARFVAAGPARSPGIAGSAGPARSPGATGSAGATGPGTARMSDGRRRGRMVHDGRPVVDDRRGCRIDVAGIPIPVSAPRRVPEITGTPVESRLRVSLGDTAESKCCGDRCRRDRTTGELVHALCVPRQAVRAPGNSYSSDERRSATSGRWDTRRGCDPPIRLCGLRFRTPDTAHRHGGRRSSAVGRGRKTAHRDRAQAAP
jgi:hypothetical protein